MAGVLMLMSCVSMAALWIRSDSFRDSVYFSTPIWGGVVYSSAGRFGHGGVIWTRPDRWHIERQAIRTPDVDRSLPFILFQYRDNGWQIQVPHGLVVVLLGLQSLVFMRIMLGGYAYVFCHSLFRYCWRGCRRFRSA